MAITPAGRGPELSGVVGFMLALTTLSILMRSYCRVVLVKSFGFDDWFAVIAWVFFVLFCTFAIGGVYHGTGQHAKDIIPPTVIPVGIKWWWACEPVYVLSNMAMKLSIAIMLLRLTVRQSHRIIIYVVIIVTEIYSLFFFFLFVLQCRPSSYFWTRYTGGKGSCIDPMVTVNATYAYSAVSCVGDWVFAILPCFMVWGLQMNSRTKVSVALILGMGGIASTATIVRIPYVHTLKNEADFLYATTDVAIWSTAETGLGIAACSIATLRPLFRAFLGRSHLLGGTSTNKQPSSGWPSGGRRSQGYIKNLEQGGIALRADMKSEAGVTTVIESSRGADLGKNGGGSKKGLGSQSSFKNGSGWRGSDESVRGLGGSSDDEVDWRGIKKVTVSSQVVGHAN